MGTWRGWGRYRYGGPSTRGTIRPFGPWASLSRQGCPTLEEFRQLWGGLSFPLMISGSLKVIWSLSVDSEATIPTFRLGSG